MKTEELHAARDAHRAALAQFVAAASRIDTSHWSVPRAEGKWSPGQIAEHLALAYDSLIAEMNGGAGMKVRTTWWQRAILRVSVVPELLRTGRFPSGARAPREVRPPDTPAAKDVVLARLQERATEFDERIEQFAKLSSARLTHAYFGRVSPLEVVRFCEIHLQHHQIQLGV